MRWWFYWKHYWKSRRRHGTHSPFVYDLAEQVLLKFPKFYIPLTKDQELRYFQNLANQILNYLLTVHYGKISFSNVEVYKTIFDSIIGEADIIVVYTLYPHTFERKYLKSLDPYNMVLDFGGCIFLLKNQAFLHKQYFTLH